MRFLHFLKTHAFLVFFLLVQIVFLVWVIGGATTYDSCSDQDTTCQAGQVGTTIGLGLIIALWVATDLILGITYGIYRLATRGRRAESNHAHESHDRRSHDPSR